MQLIYVWRKAELFAKRLVGVIATLYVVGFSVSAVAFAQYGLASFDLLRTQYVLAGIWATLPFMVILPVPAIVRAAHRQWEQHVAPIRNHSRGLPVVIGFIYAGCITVLLQLLLGGAPEKIFAPQHNLRDFLLLLAVFALVAGAIRLSYAALARRRQGPPETGLDIGTVGGLTWLVVFAAAFYIFIFAVIVYRRIPSSIGGGAPTEVLLVLRQPLNLGGTGVSTTPSRLVRCAIITERENGLILLIRDRIVRIPADAVEATVFVEHARTRSVLDQILE